MEKHRTTIRELADYTGLSPAAVSYALRGMQVSAETERRVREMSYLWTNEGDWALLAREGGGHLIVQMTPPDRRGEILLISDDALADRVKANMLAAGVRVLTDAEYDAMVD